MERDPLNTCANGEHKRIEVTCLDCIEKLGADRDAALLQSKTDVYVMGEISKARDEAFRRLDAALLQNGELRDGIRLALTFLNSGGEYMEQTKARDDTVKALYDGLRKAGVALDVAEKPLRGPCKWEPVDPLGNCPSCGQLHVAQKRQDAEAMVWRACPEHKSLEKKPFKWGPPPWHPCPNCEYRNIIESREAGPETFTEKRIQEPPERRGRAVFGEGDV